ncbi:MAG: hypothetical protein AB1512_19805 [Thermodesulfobacteriota bacterium]
MKVYEGQGMTLHETLRKKRAQEAPLGDFQGILDQMKSQQDGESAPANKGRLDPVPPGGIQILGGVGDMDTARDGGLRNQALQDLEGALDLVDFYATRLADRSLSVRDLESLVGHLEERVERLRSLQTAAGLPDGLKSLLSETTLTIGLEVAKFRRGDYR